MELFDQLDGLLALVIASGALGTAGAAIKAALYARTLLRQRTLLAAISNGVRWAYANRRSLDSVPEVLDYVKRGSPQAYDWAVKQGGLEHLRAMVMAARADFQAQRGAINPDEAMRRTGEAITERQRERMARPADPIA